MLFLLLLLIPATEALPVPAITDNQQPPSPSCDDINNCRTLWNIILSCLTTVFLCTWVAIHPNIPKPAETPDESVTQKFLHSLRTLFLERIPLFVCMLLVPDYILAAAVRQWQVATEISRNTGWSKTHGFFIIMGGFHFFKRTQRGDDYGKPVHPLTKTDVTQLFGKETIQFPAEAEIKEDENPAVVETKDDENPAAAKTKNEHPAVEPMGEHPAVIETKENKSPAVVETKGDETPAEIKDNENPAVMEAKDEHPAVNTKNDEDPVATETKSERPAVVETKAEDPAVGIRDQFPTEAEIQDKSKNDWLAKALVIVQTLWFITQCIARGYARLPMTKLELVTLAYTTMNLGIYLAWWHKPYDVTRPIRVFTNPPISIGTGPTKRLYYWARPNSELEEKVELAGNYLIGAQDKFTDMRRAKKVPAFYSGDPDNRKIYIADAITLLVGVVFGAVHLIGWSFEFPSYTELLLWRVSSATIAGVPVCFVAAGGIQRYFINDIKRLIQRKLVGIGIESLVNILASGVGILIVVLYIASRLTTLVLAFTTLRSLPPGSYIVVAWTSFIPHI